MKKILFLLLLSFFNFNQSNGKVITVSSSPDVVSQYNNLQKAIDDAEEGDTLYIHGPCGSATLNKRLVIIGAGYRPNNEVQIPAEIQLMLNGATGSIIQGIKVTIKVENNSDSSHSIIVRRCLLISPQTSNSPSVKIQGNYWTIYNCIVDGGIDLNNCSNIRINNNIIIRGYNFKIKNSDKNSVLIKNNYFSADNGYTCFFEVFSSIVNNNIFYYVPDGSEFCSYNNNISVSPLGEWPPSNNSGSNNLENTDPEFVIKNDPSSFDYEDDLHLKSTSPGKNAGTDSTDIGIYGGDFPWPDNSDGTPDYTGESNLPKVQSLSVSPIKVMINESIRINSIGIKKDRSE